MDRCRPFRGGRKLLIHFSLLCCVLLGSGCTTYDSLTARAERAEGRAVDLQRLANELESRLAVRQGEIRELQRKYGELQVTNEQLQDELLTYRADEDEAMDGTGVAHVAHTEDQETGFEDIDSVEVRRDGEQIRLTLPQSILFRAGSAELMKSSQVTFRTIAEVLKKEHGKPGVRVEGHTDSTPLSSKKKIWPSNWELSAARASSVLRALQGTGAIDISTSYVVGYGAERPVASNDNKEGKRTNRRVEIVILP